MNRRVQWSTHGAAPLDGLEGIATAGPRDVLLLTAALRDLQRLSGLEVTALGPCCEPSREGRRVYSVRMQRQGATPVACQLVLERDYSRFDA